MGSRQSHQECSDGRGRLTKARLSACAEVSHGGVDWDYVSQSLAAVSPGSQAGSATAFSLHILNGKSFPKNNCKST